MRRTFAAGAAALLLSTSLGCGMVINGRTSTIEVKSSTPGAKVYLDGGEAKGPILTDNLSAHVVLVRAPGHLDHVEVLEPHVPAGPIILDVIFAVPSIFIAPLMDGLVGGFYSNSMDPMEVKLEKAKTRSRARTVYQVGTTAVESKPGNVQAPEPVTEPEPPVDPGKTPAPAGSDPGKTPAPAGSGPAGKPGAGKPR